MDTLNHLVMSIALKQKIEDELNIKLDTAGFLFGSIKPDLAPFIINVPHYKNDAMDFIKVQIKALLAYKIDRYGKCTRQFSERLGVITHFLSDFFCYAHSDYFTGNIINHFFYEVRLFGYFRKRFRTLKAFKYALKTNRISDFKSICSLIDELHVKYMDEKPSFALDIAFSLKMCAALSFSIISACISENMELAA